MNNARILLVFTFACVLLSASAQAPTEPKPEEQVVKKSNWYDNISLKGYLQVRYNRLLETNEQLKCEQCDKSWGENGGFMLRRMRLIFSGHLTKKIYFYVQPDFASTSGNNLHFGQIRDAYVDLSFDNNNEFRLRLGQSKVPYGFENLQSSSKRLPLDRDDALNSAVANERDIGGFLYWVPKDKKALLARMNNEGYKWSGDYGVVAFGVFNGQTANKPELNDNLHVVGRVTYPFTFKNMIFEPGIQAYTGKFTLPKEQVTPGVKVVSDLTYTDQRVAASLIMYPNPFGFQVEYNVGEGPEYNKQTDSIELNNLKGGYVMLNYKLKIDKMVLYPFTRYQYYDGGKKQERDARSYNVNELEIGVEWQPSKYFELVAMYTISDRRFEDGSLVQSDGSYQDNRQSGNLLRLQAQLNF